MLKFHNQLTKSEQDFTPEDPKNVKIYTCGPTVYSYAHIGNLTAYIYWDFLIRVLTLSGYSVNRVLNLTDVGHLASDADDGEDKLEKGAKSEGSTVWQIADKYIAAFKEDYQALNLLPPQKFARATDYIEEEKDLVDRLIEKGYTYETTDGVYFDTTKFPAYADFANLDLENLKAGARVAMSSEKKSPSDFAVWKFVREGEDHAMQWDFLGRPGYPGWHLECATIIHAELGGTIDIHTGGIDHIPVHHTNEIAEYECGYGERLANYWLHNNFITVDGEKISKSLGNTYTLANLAEKGFSPLDYKMWTLQGQYHTERNFTFDNLQAAKNRRLSWRNRIAACYQGKAYETAKTQPASVNAKSANPNGNNAQSTNNHTANTSFSRLEHKTLLAIASYNLNSAEVLSKIDNSTLDLEDWKFVDELLGLDLIATTPDITAEIAPMIKDRETARKNHDYQTADQIRDDLAAKNITILDTPTGPIWQYLN